MDTHHRKHSLGIYGGSVSCCTRIRYDSAIDAGEVARQQTSGSRLPGIWGLDLVVHFITRLQRVGAGLPAVVKFGP